MVDADRLDEFQDRNQAYPQFAHFPDLEFFHLFLEFYVIQYAISQHSLLLLSPLNVAELQRWPSIQTTWFLCATVDTVPTISRYAVTDLVDHHVPRYPPYGLLGTLGGPLKRVTNIRAKPPRPADTSSDVKIADRLIDANSESIPKELTHKSKPPHSHPSEKEPSPRRQNKAHPSLHFISEFTQQSESHKAERKRQTTAPAEVQRQSEKALLT